MKAKDRGRITVLYRKQARSTVKFEGRTYQRTEYAIEEGRGNEDKCVIVILPARPRPTLYSPMYLYKLKNQI